MAKYYKIISINDHYAQVEMNGAIHQYFLTHGDIYSDLSGQVCERMCPIGNTLSANFGTFKKTLKSELAKWNRDMVRTHG